MKKILAVAAFVAFFVSSAVSAFAMMEEFPWVEHTLTKGAACGESEGTYGLEGLIEAGTKMRVKIEMTAIYKDGRRATVTGTPVFVIAPSVATMDRLGALVKPKNGVYTAPKDGVFRVFVGELQSDDYFYERVWYEGYKILVCPAL